jgi:hypothetical protein
MSVNRVASAHAVHDAGHLISELPEAPCPSLTGAKPESHNAIADRSGAKPAHSRHMWSVLLLADSMRQRRRPSFITHPIAGVGWRIGLRGGRSRAGGIAKGPQEPCQCKKRVKLRAPGAIATTG